METLPRQTQGYSTHGKAVSAPPGSRAQADLLRERLLQAKKTRGLTSNKVLAFSLGIGYGVLSQWLNGRKLPNRKQRRNLVAEGVLSFADAAALKPVRKPRGYSLRGVRVYTLQEYAARA